MADRVMVLRYGELVEEAPTRTMLADPQQPYTKSLWAVRALHKEGTPADDDLLRVNAVDASYGAFKVLHGVTIRVPRGRTVAVVGEFGLGQVDPGTGHHRPAAAAMRARSASTASRSRRDSRTVTRACCGASR